jgi:methyl-accepting chemotaxis protein
MDVRLGLRGKLLAVFLAVCLVPVGAISIVALSDFSALNDQSNQQYEHNLKTIVYLDGMRANLNFAHLFLTSYVTKSYLNTSVTDLASELMTMSTNGDAFGSKTISYQRNQTLSTNPNLMELLRSAGNTALSTQEDTYLIEMQDNWDSYLTQKDNAIRVSRTPIIEARPITIAEQSQIFQYLSNATGNYTEVENSLSEIISIREQVSKIANDAAYEIYIRTILSIIAGMGLIAALIVAGAMYIATRITKPILEVARIANEIQEGNLSPTIDVEPGKDEIGHMLDSFRQMVGTTFAPIRELREASEIIASGDLTKDVSSSAKGDVQKLVSSFDLMLDSLREIVSDVRETSSLVSSTSDNLASISEEMNSTTEEVSTAIQRIASGAQHQAEKIKEVVKVVGDQLASVEQVVSSAESAADASTKASEVAQKGGDSAQVALQKMREIQAVVDGATGIVRKLGERTKEIHQIVNVITNIAQQTNLLALNAAIEAARAGEHGRGFAVVADEVRKLAEGSGRAASQISVLVDQIDTETRRAVDQMESGAKNVSVGASVIDSALSSLEDIAATIQQTAAMVQEITAATEEQKASAEKIVQAVDEVAKIAEDTSASSEQTCISTESLTANMQEMTASAQELARLAGLMQSSVERFLLPPPEVFKKDGLSERMRQEDVKKEESVKQESETKKERQAIHKKSRFALAKKEVKKGGGSRSP